MKNRHDYTLQLNWSGDKELSCHSNDRLYQIQIEGKELILGSADKPFFGNPNLYNPEDLLLSALSSCHMMSFYYVCRKRDVAIHSYQDNPVGTVKVNIDGSGQFEHVTLNPQIILVDASQIALATELHNEASKLCFIANSCNFEIEYNFSIE